MVDVLTPRRVWGMARITAVTETSSGGRIWSTAFHIALPLWLAVLLWHGLYTRRPVVAGVTAQQAVTYAVVAALLTYLRLGNRGWARDTLPQHIRLGTVQYWFLWPIRPAAYHAARAAGDIGYALAWAIPAYLVCLLTGSVQPPAGSAAGLLFVVSLLLGQVVGYLIGLLLELVCFWTLINDQVLSMIAFVQALLSGGFAPLYFFPGWFQAASALLPFASIVNTPMSIYLGRATGVVIVGLVGEQLLWCVLLGALAALLWRRAASRVDVMGG